MVCGLAAGGWLGAPEAPTKLVNVGFSPFAISLCMVAGVFTARWLGWNAVVPPLEMDLQRVAVLSAILLASLFGGGWALWRWTRFS